MTKQNKILSRLSEAIIMLNNTIDQLSEELDEAEFVLQTAPLMQRQEQLKSEFNRLSSAVLETWQGDTAALLKEFEICNAKLTIETAKLQQTIKTIDKINNIMSYTDQIIKLAASIAV